MKQITTSKGTFLFVEVPDDIMFQSINFRTKGFMHFKTYSCTSTWSHNTLPDGNYQIICTTKNATDESADMFGICAITKDGTLYKYGLVANDGLPAAQGEKGWCWSDFEPTLQLAINKLLKQNKLSTKNNYAIIQKQ
jgi:hypothetical protein